MSRGMLGKTYHGLRDTTVVSPADPPTVSLSPEGKRILTKAREASGISFAALAAQVGAKAPTVRALVLDEASIGKGTPAWSSDLIPGICRVLRVPLWKVLLGIEPDHRRILEAFDELRTVDSDRYRSLLEQVIEMAGDKAARAILERANEQRGRLP